MKKRILYIITQSEWGGAQRYLLELVTHLNPNKYNITIAAGPGGAFLDLLKAKKCQIYRLKHLVREIHLIKDIKAYFELKKLIYATKPDILQLLSTKTGILGSLALVRCQMSDVRCIYRIGGWVFTEELPKWKKILYEKLEKWTAKFKDIIVVNCEAHRQLAIDLKIAPAEKIITIYNGIDLDKLQFLTRDVAREKLKVKCQMLNVSCQQIGCIANFYKNKGLEYLVRAMSNVRCQMLDARCIIIGDGIERPNLEKLIRDLKLENRVVLAGKLPNAYQHLKALDIFILPSIKEGQPWSILEAMAAEVPIIATNIAAIPEMIRDGESGLLVEPKNPQAIAEKIEYLIKNPEIAKSFTKNARQIIEKRFTTKTMTEKTEKLYE